MTCFSQSYLQKLPMPVDENMRRSYSENLSRFMAELGTRHPQDIVDLGCASGLSTLELSRCFPEADILGIDLSPYFLAVANVLQQQRCQVFSCGWFS